MVTKVNFMLCKFYHNKKYISPKKVDNTTNKSINYFYILARWEGRKDKEEKWKESGKMETWESIAELYLQSKTVIIYLCVY